MTERTILHLARGALAAFLLVLIPVIFHLPLPGGSGPLLLAWVIMAVAAVRILFISLRARPAMMDIAFWIFVYVFFGVAAISQIASVHFPETPTRLSSAGYTDATIVATQVRILVGMGAYELGRWLWRRLSGGRRPTTRWDRLTVSEGKCLIVGWLGVVIAMALVFKTGISLFFSSRDQLTVALYSAAGNVHGYRVFQLQSKGLGSFQQVLLNVPVLVVMVYLLGSGLWRRHKLLFLATVGVSVITNNPISNPRYWTGVVFAGLLAALIDLSRRSRHVYFALGLLLTTMFSLSYLNVFRAPLTAAQQRVTAIQDQSASRYITSSLDYGMFQQELNATDYVTQSGFTNGQQLAGAVFVYIPHTLWKSKPGATGELVGQEVGLQQNISSSLWTELYIDFGYPELVIGFAGIGYLFSYLDDAFARSRSLAARLIIPIAATFSIFLMRGSLQPAIGFGVPVFVVLLFCLRRQPTTSASRPAPSVVPASS